MKKHQLPALLLLLTLLAGCGKPPAGDPARAPSPGTEAPSSTVIASVPTTAPPQTTEATQPTKPTVSEALKKQVFSVENGFQSGAINGAGETVLPFEYDEVIVITDDETGQQTGLIGRTYCKEEGRWDAIFCDSLFSLDGRLLTDGVEDMRLLGQSHNGMVVRNGYLTIQEGDWRCVNEILRLEDGASLARVTGTVTPVKRGGLLVQLSHDADGNPTEESYTIDCSGSICTRFGDGITVTGSNYEGSRTYFSVLDGSSGRYGVVDDSGQRILDCVYEEVCSLQGNTAVVMQRRTYEAFDLRSGECLLQRDTRIEYAEKDFSIVEGPTGGLQLLDEKGLPLYPQPFNYVGVLEHDKDGNAVILSGWSEGIGTILLRPDGTVAFSASAQSDQYTYVEWIGNDRMIVSGGGDPSTAWLVDAATGEQLNEKPYISMYQVEGRNEAGERTRYCAGYYKNIIGNYRTDLLDIDGNILAENLDSIGSVTCGVVDCCKGQYRGLMTLDGAWLYRTSAYALLKD